MKSRILIIDDEKGIRFTFKRFLLDEGYAVTTAGEYNEAIALITETEFDVIFADIILGDKTGIDILREARKRNLGYPVIMITGYPSIETVSYALRLGAFDYIAKPVTKETLLHTADKASRYKKTIDEEEKYRSNLGYIFKSIKDTLIAVDKEKEVIEINEAAQTVCGFSRDVIGKKFDDITGECDGNCLEAVERTLTHKHPVEDIRFGCRSGKKQDMIVTLATSPLLDRHGVFSGAVLVIRDETRRTSPEPNPPERQQFYNIIGKSKEMQKIYSLIEDLADVQSTVLITGQSGTGKELVAEALHYKGIRGQKPLVKVNCSALSETLLESELFGHVKGAFTNADSDRIGRFQRADGGSIFLDEIGDISPTMQLSLLRVLQEKEFERVGDSMPIKVDVRVIAAANKDLREKVAKGEFREDMYYRLNVVNIHMPPLRERREDIPLLINHFLKKFGKKLHKNIAAVSNDVLELFMKHPWPGNVRELEHALEHASILCRNSIITAGHLPTVFNDFKEGEAAPGIKRRPRDYQSILKTLKKTGWNKSKAARLLGVSVRTIYRKIEKYNIPEEKS